jgi:two-component sensor histidine kinase/ligand-binding sensor domain-containing protein
MKRQLNYCCILLLLSILTGVNAFTQTDVAGYTVTKRLISIEDGLASHEVFCGLQDDYGFMWFGTRNGLNRYDGKNSLIFTRQRNKLQDNKVVQLAKDNAGNIFIEYGSTGFQLVTNGKVDVMNVITKKVKSLTNAFPNLPFKEQDVYWLSNDGSGQINFLTANPFRLWKYSAETGFKLRYEMTAWQQSDPIMIEQFRTTGPLCFFAKGKALLKLHNQAPQYLVTEDTVISFTQKDALRSLPLGYTKQNDLLIAYNTASEENSFTIGNVSVSGASQFPSLNRPVSTDSIKGRYWFQSSFSNDGNSSILDIPTEGLYLWNEHTFQQIANKTEIKNLENLFLYQLIADQSGRLWLCTSSGVLQLRLEKNRFQQFFTRKQQTTELNSQARGIYADKTGQVAANIWSSVFYQQNKTTKSANDHEIKYALINHQSSFYAGGYNLFNYDEKKNKLNIYPGGAGTEIWSMYALSDSLLLLGRTNGFNLFNIRTKHFDTLVYTDPETTSARFVYRFFKGKNDSLWAIAENGLYNIIYKDTGNGKPAWSVIKREIPLLSNISYLDAYTDTSGIFWFATNGEGLYRSDQASGMIQQFNIANGFPSDVLYRIEPDEFGNLWISSDYGLIRFNTHTYAVNTYTTADGISHNEFNRTSSFKAADGRLFFGGLDGINAFAPQDFLTDTSSLTTPLRIISFNQFIASSNQLVNKTSDVLNTTQITMAPGDRFFTLEFRLLDFEKDAPQRYAYKIEGLDKDWIFINENSIRISGLPYGDFVLRVKAQNREGSWSTSELSIPLIVLRPFYLKWWFMLITGILIIAGVISIIRFRTKKLAGEKIRLEQTVEERTAQLKHSLSEQAELLSEKDVLMKEIHHRVKNNLQVISGLLELQGKSVENESAKEALREGQNRVRSIALIHQNLYQFENLSGIELKRFITDLCRQVESVYKKQKETVLNIDVPATYLDIDSAVPLGLIMNELLSNSFKYALNEDKLGKIDLRIRSIEEGRYELLFRDNGPGLPSGFDLKRSTTLGMQLIYDLSRQIGGKVKYEYDNGAVFIINFTNRNLRKNQD